MPETFKQSMDWEEFKHKQKASKLWDDRLEDFLQVLFCKQHKFGKFRVNTLEYWLGNKYSQEEYDELMKRAKVLFNA